MRLHRRQVLPVQRDLLQLLLRLEVEEVLVALFQHRQERDDIPEEVRRFHRLRVLAESCAQVRVALLRVLERLSEAANASFAASMF